MKKILVIVALASSTCAHSMKNITKFSLPNLKFQAKQMSSHKSSNAWGPKLIVLGISGSAVWIGFDIYQKMEKKALERRKMLRQMSSAQYIPTINEVVTEYSQSIAKNQLEKQDLISFLQHNLSSLQDKDIKALLNAIVKSSSQGYLNAFIEGASTYYLNKYHCDDQQNRLLMSQLLSKFPAWEELSSTQEQQQMLAQIIEFQDK